MDNVAEFHCQSRQRRTACHYTSYNQTTRFQMTPYLMIRENAPRRRLERKRILTTT
ncbi:hypothetical protein DY000_02016741 [Brassica cretica]|uniref:Uncharacterized protein n=1 Tax=Brassica cretica TaxID=69181 RepID=A0ABQ7CLN1_BRACR|nr:hypothetical protein DY000_02016741 [Brassica cretica]